jgi:hypothetical protein
MIAHLRALQAAGVLILALVVGTPAGSTRAAQPISMKQYANAGDRLNFSYPSTWQTVTFPTAGDAVLVSIAPTVILCFPHDQRAGLSVLVAPHATDTHTLKAKVMAVIHDNMTTVAGPITFGTTTLNEVRYLRATFAGTNTSHELVAASILATSRRNRTYYLLVGIDTKPAASGRDRTAVAAIVASVHLT